MRISLRHRHWGFDCPMVDIDFLVIEYNHGRCAGIVEYKHTFAKVQLSGHPSYRALRVMADSLNVPFIGCRYSSDCLCYKATTLSREATKLWRGPRLFTEPEWVEFLYQMRGLRLPDLFDAAGRLRTNAEWLREVADCRRMNDWVQ